MADTVPRRHVLQAIGAAGAASMLSNGSTTSTHAQPNPATAGRGPADLVLRNGKVITVDAAFTIAQAIAIAGDRIVAVGPDAAMAAHTAPATRVVDLKGKTVIPGIIDGHAHMDREALRNVFPSLGRVRSIRDIQDRIAELARGKTAGRMDRHHADRRSALLLRRARNASPRSAGRRGRSSTPRRPNNPVYIRSIWGYLARHLAARLLRQHRGAQARRHHPRHRLAGRHARRSRRTPTAIRPACSSSTRCSRSRS